MQNTTVSNPLIVKQFVIRKSVAFSLVKLEIECDCQEHVIRIDEMIDISSFMHSITVEPTMKMWPTCMAV